MSKKILTVNPVYRHLQAEIEQLFDSAVANKSAQRKRGESAEWLPKDGEYIYRGRNSLYRIKLGGHSMIVKDFKRPHIINRHVYTTLRKSKAARSYQNAFKMKELGFKTPEPVAYFEYREGTSLLYSFYVSLELKGATEMRHWENRPETKKVLPLFAKEIFKLHRSGVYHRDFSPGNILYVANGGGSYDFYFVDLNRMKFNIHNPKMQMRMFRSINLNYEETERLARLYADEAGINPDKTAAEAKRQLKRYLKRAKL